MAAIVNDLTIIKIHWEGKTYQIKAEKVKDNDKQTIDTTYASDSHDPQQIHFGKCEYSIDLSGVQSHRWLFAWIRERQRTGYFKMQPHLAIYKYDNGSVKLDRYYRGVFVEEISEENKDPFDVKLVAMSRDYRDSKNKFIGS